MSEADQVWQATQIMARQVRDLEARLPALKQTATAAKQSFQQGNRNLDTYVRLQANWLAQQAAAIRLRASLDQAQAALEILLGQLF